VYNEALAAVKLNVKSAGADTGWAAIQLLGPVVVCLGFMWFYRRRRIGCYPGTFIYCFHVPEYSNPGHRTRVVGYLRVMPDRDEGEIIAEGASLTWDDYVVRDSVTRYTSTHVYGSKKDREIRCHIRFDINEEYRENRNYEHGVLQFQPVRSIDQSKGADRYAGYMRSTNNDPEVDTAIRCKGYAEKLNVVNGRIEDILEREGEYLFAQLNTLLSEQIEVPSLWVGGNLLRFNGKNCFDQRIPSPQSTILNGRVSTFIDAALDKMLAGIGITASSINSFKKTARTLARQDEEFKVEIFEADVKRALSEKLERGTRPREFRQHAKAVHDRIKRHLEGKSLLDVGCGNALVSEFLKSSFSTIHLLDVVDYRDTCGELPFQKCTDGHKLPGDEQYDTVLLLNVLHHSAQPRHLLDSAWEKTLKRLIVIEPVVGVHEVDKATNSKFARLDDAEQFAYAAFVDWFYNRILHNDVPVGYNFTTPDKWESIFREKNAAIVHKEYISEDIELEPMPHVLYVLEKQESLSHESDRVAA
jgi:hypothetical protein